MNNPNNPFSQALDTLTQRWGGWEAPLRVAGATKADVALIKSLLADPYQEVNRGRKLSAMGHLTNALEMLPVFTFADLHTCTETIEAMVKAYYSQGGDVSTSTAVRRARLSGKPSPEMIRFLLYCGKNYKKDVASVTT